MADRSRPETFWLVLWEPMFKNARGAVKQLGCVFATHAEAKAMVRAWPGGRVMRVVESKK